MMEKPKKYLNMKNLKFSAIFQPTTLFSLKESNSTNSGAKSLFLPSPYAIKMAILNQAITLGNLDFSGERNERFREVRDLEIGYFLQGNFCVNNCFIKILKPNRSEPGVQQTVSFREYIHINTPIEIIFTVQTEEQRLFLKRNIHKISYFGKRGCFVQFLEYKEHPNEPNVIPFNKDSLRDGILQEYDDFDDNCTFDNVNSFGKKPVKRKKQILNLPLIRVQSSKAFSNYALVT